MQNSFIRTYNFSCGIDFQSFFWRYNYSSLRGALVNSIVSHHYHIGYSCSRWLISSCYIIMLKFANSDLLQRTFIVLTWQTVTTVVSVCLASCLYLINLNFVNILWCALWRNGCRLGIRNQNIRVRISLNLVIFSSHNYHRQRYEYISPPLSLG